jgi:hypothetical protein
MPRLSSVGLADDVVVEIPEGEETRSRGLPFVEADGGLRANT